MYDSDDQSNNNERANLIWTTRPVYKMARHPMETVAQHPMETAAQQPV